MFFFCWWRLEREGGVLGLSVGFLFVDDLDIKIEHH
jgi:hypothetical protein